MNQEPRKGVMVDDQNQLKLAEVLLLVAHPLSLSLSVFSLYFIFHFQKFRQGSCLVCLNGSYGPVSCIACMLWCYEHSGWPKKIITVFIISLYIHDIRWPVDGFPQFSHVCLFVCLIVFLTHFQQYFSYIVAVSFIGGENRSSQWKPPTCRKSLTNVIT